MNKEQLTFERVIRARKNREKRMKQIANREATRQITKEDAVIKNISPTPKKSWWRRVLTSVVLYFKKIYG